MDDQRKLRIANWLRSTRESQIDPKTRKPWTYGFLIDQMKAKVGWAPFASNMSRYETGAQKLEPETLDKFIAFWSTLGIHPPDFDVAAPIGVTESEDPLIRALTRQTLAIESLVKLLTPLLEDTASGVASRLGAVEDVVELLSAQAIGAPSKPSVPRKTAE